jgi:hypothetical protein
VTFEPSDGQSNVGLRDPVTVTFSMPVDPASLAFRPIDVGIVGFGGVPGTTAIVPDGTGRTLRFSPDVAMVSNQNYAVFLAATIRSTTGQSLGEPRSSQFRTANAADLPTPAQFHTAQGTLDTGRRGHTATLLDDGRVLIAGGFTVGTAVTDRAEVFDPSTEASTPLSSRMREPRALHTATKLADGRVLLAGGYYEVSIGTLNTTRGAEVFDPATDSFGAVGNLILSRTDHAALLLPDGRVLVTGGGTMLGTLTRLDTAEAYDPTTTTWSAWPNRLSHTRSAHGMVDVGAGRYFLAGGSSADLRCETFSTATGLFTPLAVAQPDFTRFGPAVETFADGDAAVAGGDSVGTVLHYDAATNTVVNTGSGLNTPRAYATATRYADDKIVVVGGIDFSGQGALLSTVDVIVQGGVGGSQTFSTTVRFPTGMADHTATRLADGRVMFCGGLDSGGDGLVGIHLFDP